MVMTRLSKTLVLLVPYFLLAYIYVYVFVIQRASIKHEILQEIAHQTKGLKSKEAFLTSSLKGNNKLKDRVNTVESKLNSYLGWGIDPFMSGKTATSCKKKTDLHEYCGSIHGNNTQPCHMGFYVCLDDFPFQQNDNNKDSLNKDCVVYDFGIREQPDFGVVMSRPPFNCRVLAFDPSPVTKKWYESNTTLARMVKSSSNYELKPYGGGYADETLYLNEYDWDQVSIVRFPFRVVNPHACTQGKCKYFFHNQKQFRLPVRSVPSIMAEHGHEHLTILKLDVEGSEYRMIESIIDSGACKQIDQLLLEWHHYDIDVRYGEGSIPIHNVIHSMLKEKCGLEQFWIHDSTGWPSNEKMYFDMHMTMRYNLASFKRVAPVPSQFKGQVPQKIKS